MNASIANILIGRIEAADLGFVDKMAGLVRAVTDTRQGKPVIMPVSCNVNDPLACGDSMLGELRPDDKYRSVMFFEGDTFPRKIVDRVLGRSYEAHLRLIVWLNCEKLGGSCNCGDIAAMQLMNVLTGRVNDQSPFMRLRLSVTGGGPTRGKDIFSKYTFDDGATQFLNFPFDAFALDIVASFRLFPGCAEESVVADSGCWVPPKNPRKRYPSEFSCEDLLHPTHGLTEEQLGPECLDCEGGGPCDPLTWELKDEGGNLLDSGSVEAPCGSTLPVEAPSATITRDGQPYGDALAGGSLDVPSNCLPGEAYPVDTDGTPVGAAVPVPSGASVPVTAPDGSVRTSDGADEVMPIKSGEIKPLPKSKILYLDATGSDVFTALYDNKFDGDLYPAITIPRRELLNMYGDPVSSPATYVALDHLIDGTLPQAPDSTIDINGTPFANALSGGALNVPVKDTDGVPRGSKVGSDWIVPAPGVGPVLEFAFADRDQYTMVWTIKSFTAGTYSSFTPTGTYGTITYSKNVGPFLAVTGSIVLAIGDTIQLKRSNTTGVAGTTWVP